MKSAGTDLYIERLLDGAALLTPVMLQGGNQTLEGVQIVLQVDNSARQPCSGLTIQRKGVNGRLF